MPIYKNLNSNVKTCNTKYGKISITIKKKNIWVERTCALLNIGGSHKMDVSKAPMKDFGAEEVLFKSSELDPDDFTPQNF